MSKLGLSFSAALFISTVLAASAVVTDDSYLEVDQASTITPDGVLRPAYSLAMMKESEIESESAELMPDVRGSDMLSAVKQVSGSATNSARLESTQVRVAKSKTKRLSKRQQVRRRAALLAEKHRYRRFVHDRRRYWREFYHIVRRHRNRVPRRWRGKGRWAKPHKPCKSRFILGPYWDHHYLYDA